jgi:hypothetical protein
VEFADDFVSFATIVVFYRNGITTTYLKMYEQNDEGLNLPSNDPFLDVPTLEPPFEFPMQDGMSHMAAMKLAILAGLADNRSYVAAWDVDRRNKVMIASSMLLYLHRDALHGTTLEKPEFIPYQDQTFYREQARTPYEDFIRMTNDLVNSRFNL